MTQTPKDWLHIPTIFEDTFTPTSKPDIQLKGIELPSKLSDVSIQRLCNSNDQEDANKYYTLITEIHDHVRYVKRKNLYVLWLTGKHSGSIGYIKNVETFSINKSRRQKPKRRTIYSRWENPISMKIKVAFDDRPNLATVRLFDYSADSLALLTEYTGPTIWNKLDQKSQSEQDMKDYPITDIRDNLIKVNDIVSFVHKFHHIRDKYTNKSVPSLDYGIVRKIKYVYKLDYNRQVFRMPSVEIESILHNYYGRKLTTEVNTPENSILIITNTDLQDDAFLAKLQSD